MNQMLLRSVELYWWSFVQDKHELSMASERLPSNLSTIQSTKCNAFLA